MWAATEPCSPAASLSKEQLAGSVTFNRATMETPQPPTAAWDASQARLEIERHSCPRILMPRVAQSSVCESGTLPAQPVAALSLWAAAVLPAGRPDAAHKERPADEAAVFQLGKATAAQRSQSQRSPLEGCMPTKKCGWSRASQCFVSRWTACVATVSYLSAPLESAKPTAFGSSSPSPLSRPCSLGSHHGLLQELLQDLLEASYDFLEACQDLLEACQALLQGFQ